MSQQQVIYDIGYKQEGTNRAKIERITNICFNLFLYSIPKNPQNIMWFKYYPRPPCFLTHANINNFIKSFAELFPELRGHDYFSIVSKGVKVDARKRSIEYILNLFRLVRIMAEEPHCLRDNKPGNARQQLCHILLMSHFKEQDSTFKHRYLCNTNYFKFHYYAYGSINRESVNKFFKNYKKVLYGKPYNVKWKYDEDITFKLFGSTNNEDNDYLNTLKYDPYSNPPADKAFFNEE